MIFSTSRHRDDFLPAKHLRMGNGTPDILMVQALVEVDGGGKFLDEFIGRLGEATTPEFFMSHVYSPLEGSAFFAISVNARVPCAMRNVL